MKDKHCKSLFITIGLGLFLILLISFIASGGFILPVNSGGWIYGYQSLFAGFLALVAATITSYFLYEQNQFQKKEAINIREKKAFYARSLMPDALSDLIEYSTTCLRHVLEEQSDNSIPRPSNSIEVIRKNIEYLKQNDAQNVFEIVSFYQILNARLANYNDNVALNKKENMIYDITLFNSYILALFDYARNESNDVGKIFPTDKMLVTSLKSILGTHKFYDNHDGYEAIIKKNEEHRESDERYLSRFDFDFQKRNIHDRSLR